VLANTIGPKIWALAKERDLRTLGDFLEARYNRAVRGWTALILWFGSLGLLAAQLIALSLVFHTVVKVPLWMGSVLGGLVAVSYFTAGGLAGSARINLLQLAVLLTGFLLAVPYAIHGSLGWDQVVGGLARQLEPGASETYLSFVGIGFTGILYYVALLSPAFVVSPGLIQKFYGARSAAAGRLGVNLNATVMLLFAAVPPCIGIIAASQFPSLADPQLALFTVFTDRLPAWLGALGLAAIFSAEVSTCDAVLFMLSTSMSVDLYRRFVNPGATESVLLRASRMAAVLSGILGIVIAIQFPSIVGSLTLFYSLVSVALFAPVLLGLYWSRPNATAALAAIAVSVPCTILLNYRAGSTVLGFLNPFAVGILVSFGVLWSVALLRK
jgi:SSS family solute:Na+ symporter